MAITSIDLEQTNVFGSSNLLPINQPLIFSCIVTFTGDAPEVILANLYDSSDTLLDSFKCIPYEGISTTEQKYIFEASEFLRGYVSFEDHLQLSDTFVHIDNITAQLKVAFSDSPNTIESDKFSFTAIHAARQFGEKPNLYDIYTNFHEGETESTPQTIYAKNGGFIYIYYYNYTGADTIDILVDGASVGISAVSEVGYYRFKYEITKNTTIELEASAQNINITFYVIAEGCSESAELKYLDKNGQWRFFTFNQYYKITHQSQTIGSYERIFESIETAQSDRVSLGKRTTSSMALNAVVENEKLSLAAQLIESPCVNLKIASGDSLSSWLKVDVKTNNALIRRGQGASGDLSLNIELPRVYNVTHL